MKPETGEGSDAGRIPRMGMSAFGTAYHSLPDNDPTYAVIGKVAAEWASLEHALDTTIWALSGLNAKEGSCLTAQILGYRGRIDAIEALALSKGASKEAIEHLNKMAYIIRDLARKRNRFVHDAWYTDSRGVGQFVSFTGDSREFGVKQIDKESAELLVGDLKERVRKILKLKRRLLAETGA